MVKQAEILTTVEKNTRLILELTELVIKLTKRLLELEDKVKDK